MDSENAVQVNFSTRGRKDPKWKYVCLSNEKKNLNIFIDIFCDKVTTRDIYRCKQHLVDGYKNVKKCRKCS